jgi:hypothetical protein
MRRSHVRWAPGLLLVVACGGSAGDGDQSAQDATSATFPAFAQDIARTAPQLILGNGGPVMKNGKLVTVTFASDDPANLSTILAFDDAIGKSKYWHDAVGEYGVEGLQSDPTLHVQITDDDMPRMTHGNTKGPDGNFSNVLGMLDRDLISFMDSHAKSGEWPKPTDDTLYAVYVPKSVPLVSRISEAVGELDRIDACDSFEGFHDEKVRRGREKDDHFLYTIIYEACGGGTIQNTTDTASHELAEGATDPFSSTDDTAALNGFNMLAWTVFNERQEEIGDACEYYPDANADLTGDFAFRVQSLWSNKAARAGKNPCAPNDGSPYYNVVPLAVDDGIEVVVPPKISVPAKTMGYRIPKGSRTISLGLFSDRDIGGDWNVSAIVGGSASTIVKDDPKVDNGEERVKVSFVGPASGRNGSKIQVKISVDPSAKAEHGKTRTGVVVSFISEKQGLPKRYMPVMIALQ